MKETMSIRVNKELLAVLNNAKQEGFKVNKDIESLMMDTFLSVDYLEQNKAEYEQNKAEYEQKVRELDQQINLIKKQAEEIFSKLKQEDKEKLKNMYFKMKLFNLFTFFKNTSGLDCSLIVFKEVIKILKDDNQNTLS